MREFMTSRHLRALALADSSRRWQTFGEVLHCLQDSYSPAHADRSGAEIVRMKHWGPLGPLRHALSGGHRPDEHGFPTDARDSVWREGALTDDARAAAAVSRRYLELAARRSAADARRADERSELEAFLDECIGVGAAG